jgi:hypothetical protein
MVGFPAEESWLSTFKEAVLRDKMRKIEALFAGAGTEGERLAAGAALTRVRCRLATLQREGPPVEMQFSLGDPWSRRLFLALCRRYGLVPYRLPRQRLTTVMLKAPRRFAEEVLWPEFEELNQALLQYLNAVTLKVIREEVHRDAGEAAEVAHGVTAVAAVA